MSYIPETPFACSPEHYLVYNLKQDGWRCGAPRMVNDICIQVVAPTAVRKDIAHEIMNSLNKTFRVP